MHQRQRPKFPGLRDEGVSPIHWSSKKTTWYHFDEDDDDDGDDHDEDEDDVDEDDEWCGWMLRDEGVPQSIGPPRKLPGIIDDDDDEEKEEEEYDHDIDDDNDDDGDDHEFWPQ